MINYLKYHQYVTAFIISLLSVIFESNTKIGSIFTAYLSSFVLGIIFNAICEIEIYDKKYMEFFLKQILSYTLCISLIVTFLCIKKKNIFTSKSSKYKENVIFFESKQKVSIYNFLIRRRVLHLGVAFVFGATGTVIGGILSYYLTKIIYEINDIESDNYLKKSVACFISTYIGGYINFIEVADLLNISGEAKNSIFILDDIFTNIFLMTLPLFKKYCKITYFCNSDTLSDIEEDTKKNNNLKLNNEEKKHLISDKKFMNLYGSFINNENHQKQENMKPYLFYDFIIKLLYDSLAIILVVLLSKKIINDNDLLYKFMISHINIDKLKTFFLLIVTFTYMYTFDYIIQIVNIKTNNYKITKFITGVYFRSLEYYSTILKILTIYYLSLSGILINVKNLCAIASPLIILIICILIIHLFFTFAFSFIYNFVSGISFASISIDEILLAINANIGGPTTAALMSKILERPDLTFAATIWGVIGYLIATNISLGIYSYL
ncbi:conserved Plasmodium protein, unknown function [Plasmodium gallinaceum]|uniref:Uncharacterized protein n=1 Tax=Plasmodium gallinaceum TaxID=5849 RepID=A0A1J1GRW9_PLAGA|nr:conserved Plasmodium protein, unknown function [Plasmodium gallinaceum]CRG95044.1 conserved Plasmodium protein, unknown function [Plasmodium gallinaceum]